MLLSFKTIDVGVIYISKQHASSGPADSNRNVVKLEMEFAQSAV